MGLYTPFLFSDKKQTTGDNNEGNHNTRERLGR